MRPLELAHCYMDCFYGDRPLQEMESFLAPDLTFEGPLYTFHSSRDYLAALKRDPPENSSYRLHRQYEGSHSACLVYTFVKPGIEAIMTQFFHVRHDKITRIKLVFNDDLFH